MAAAITMEDDRESYESDPTSLVAAASVLIGHSAGSTDRLSLDTGPSCNPTYGLSEGEDRDTNIRTFSVIDSLASLCISQPRFQVVAISLQLDFKKGKLLITLAENTDVSDATVRYVADLWSQLRELSHEYEQKRVAGPKEFPAHGYLSRSPPMAEILPGEKIHSIICQIVKLIYEFTLTKFNKRVNKWWKPLRTFTRKFTEIKGKRPPGLEGEFELMMFAFLKGLTALEAESKDWPDISYWMNSAATSAKRVLDDNFRCERWALQVAGSANEPFKLRRAIEKLTSHHRYILGLIRFAHSPRLHRAFLLQMTVDRVPATAPAVTPSLPESAVEWQAFLEKLCFDEFGKDMESIGGWLKKEVEKLYHRYKGRDFDYKPHAECSLVAFLETARYNDKDRHCQPPFSYIGLSKLSCKPCDLWFKVFNSSGGRQYYTRGTHGKWYFPWVMPATPGWSGTSKLAKEMKSVYIKRIKVSTRPRSNSDSTDASDDSIELQVAGGMSLASRNMEIDSIDW